jgi:MSHA biogenesis protein MshM
MYYEHFGLDQAPFKITPNTDFFFSGGNRGPVLEALIYAITHGEGIVKVSGEVGSGKTMLCNMLQSRLPDNVEVVYLANPSVAPEDVLHAIAFELGLGVDRDADRLEVMHVLQDYLVKQHAEGQRVVVFIEESQSMPLATLEEIRLLSNLETRNDKLLQMVLFGQPELDEILRRPDIRQLRDRIAHSFRLDPLSDGDVREYLMFRMRAAGYRGPEIFSPAVVRQIAKASSGLTRRINLIADKALLAAFAENTHTITGRHVDAALRDSEFGQPSRRAPAATRFAWAAVILVAGTALGAGAYALVDRGFSKPTVASGPSSPAPGAPAMPTASRVGSPAASAARAPAAALERASDVSAPTAPLTEQPAARAAAATTNAPAAVAAAQTPTPPLSSPAAPSATPPASSQPVAASAIVGSPSAAPAAPIAAAPSAAATAQALPVVAQAAPVERAASSVAGRRGDVIASRMAATQHWLESEAKPYSIQLLTVQNEEQLRNNLKALSKFVEVDDIYMYRSVALGKPAVSVLWGSFNSRQAAAEELAELPRPLRANRPYVRSIEGIRAEVDRNSVTR